MPTHTATPVSLSDRSDILDILRGVAVLGICLANYRVFSLYIFQKPEIIAALPTAAVDKWLTYFHLAFGDGKFYSLFSLLFGIGFSIILVRNQQAGRNLELDHKGLPAPIGLLDTLFYAMSIIPMCLFYITSLCLLF